MSLVQRYIGENEMARHEFKIFSPNGAGLGAPPPGRCGWRRRRDPTGAAERPADAAKRPADAAERPADAPSGLLTRLSGLLTRVERRTGHRKRFSRSDSAGNTVLRRGCRDHVAPCA